MKIRNSTHMQLLTMFWLQESTALSFGKNIRRVLLWNHLSDTSKANFLREVYIGIPNNPNHKIVVVNEKKTDLTLECTINPELTVEPLVNNNGLIKLFEFYCNTDPSIITATNVNFVRKLYRDVFSYTNENPDILYLSTIWQ